MKNKEISYPCPCGARVKWKRKKIIQEGINCGILDIEYCPKCGSEYFPDRTMAVIEKKLKESGSWGMQKEVSFWKSGNSVVLRIPVKIAAALGLKAHMKGNIYKEDNKLVVEV